MPSAAQTPACTAWLWCWVLPPSPWGPSPGPQQATDSLINLWDEQPSEVLHHRLPRGWFALSCLINWTVLTNHVLIYIGNLPRLGSSCGSLNNYQTVWYWVWWEAVPHCSTYGGFGSKQPPQWRVFSRGRNIPEKRRDWAQGFLKELWSPSLLPTQAPEVKPTVCVCECRESGVPQAAGPSLEDMSIWCWDLRQPLKRFTPYSPLF